MSKIVTAINVMISNPELITNVMQSVDGSEYFFIYSGKHHWSILKTTDGDYYLGYYPGTPDMSELASIREEDWHKESIDCVEYRGKTLGTKEAKDSLADLHSIVNEKVYGMSEVLDDIIDSGISF